MPEWAKNVIAIFTGTIDSSIHDRPLEEFQKAGSYSIECKTSNDEPELYVSIVAGRYRQWAIVR